MRNLRLPLLTSLGLALCAWSGPAHAGPARAKTAVRAKAVAAAKTKRTTAGPKRKGQKQRLQNQLPRARTPEQIREAQQRKVEREIVTRHAKERVNRVRGMSRIFRKITVSRDYQGEYVLMRNKNVTAFLDITDPKHPGFKPKEESGEAELDRIPMHKRAHILVVPNRPREHITGSLGQSITSGDLQQTLEVVQSAEKLAKQLGIKDAKVFVNPESRVMVGYLHVHIIGERTAGYPPSLQP